MDINDLASRFPVPGVTFAPGQGALPRVSISTPAAEAHVYLHGAHVTHYQPRGGQPVLFMSGKSHFAAGKAIRGGVPIIFPWFGNHPSLAGAPAHGFARSLPWDVRDVKRQGDVIDVTFSLTPSEATRKWLPAAFDALYTVSVGPVLALTLQVRNEASWPLVFEEALHTYLAVADVRNCSIEGLSGRTFIDKVDGTKRKVQEAGPMKITGETDRVYLDTTDTVTVSDPGTGRRIVLSKQGSASTVVWNPWADKAKAMSDFGPDEWPRMLCIETANAADNRITLAPGGRHTMRAEVRSQ